MKKYLLIILLMILTSTGFAVEVTFNSDTGEQRYTRIINNSRQAWDTSTSSWSADVNFTNSAIDCTEDGNNPSLFYLEVPFSGDANAGHYIFQIWDGNSTTASPNDTFLGDIERDFTGSQLITLHDIWADTNETQTKLPTNYIAGSGTQADLENLSQAEAQSATEMAIDGKFNLAAGIVESNVKQLNGSTIQQSGGYALVKDDEGNAIASESFVQDSNTAIIAAIADVNAGVGDKTGYFLDPNGFMYIRINDPNNTPTHWDFRDWLFWGILAEGAKMEMPVVNNVGELKVYGTDGETVITTQDVNECSNVFKRSSILE